MSVAASNHANNSNDATSNNTLEASAARKRKLRSVGITGVPCWGGQPRSGVDLAPEALRNAGLVKALKSLALDVNDNGDINVKLYGQVEPFINQTVPNCINCKYVGNVTQALSDMTKKTAESGCIPLTLGGDHSIAMGSIHGMLEVHPDLRVLWVDAHSDINTPEISPSGNMHGMPVGFLMQLVDPKNYDGLEWLTQKLDPKHIAYIALRDIDDGERKLIKNLNIKAFTMKEVDECGIARVVKEALDYLSPERNSPLHLSFDIDSLDPIWAPSTGTPVPGGLTLREGRYVCEKVHESGMLCSMDLVEVNPLINTASGVKSTVDSAIEIIQTAFGLTLL